jgi:transglutaminase-like putative cysteine protease
MPEMTSERELRVTHETTTRYGARVAVACHVAHLVPRDSAQQRVHDFELEIDPPPSQHSTASDVFGNTRECFALYVPHDMLRVRAASRVHLAVPPLPDPLQSPPWDEVATDLQYRAGATFEPAAEFVYASPFVPLLRELRHYAASSFAPGRPLLAGAIDLMQRLHADVRYQGGVTEISTPLAHVFQQRQGVCQDFTHLMIGCLRALGLPARYVSGYLLSRPPQASTGLVGAEASHAWVSVWCPALGWNDLDPTNDLRVDTSHVTLALGRDYGDVMPLRGVVQGGGEHTLEVAVRVVTA